MPSFPFFNRRPPASKSPAHRPTSPGWIDLALEADDRRALRLQFVFFVLAVLVLTLLLELVRAPTASTTTALPPCESGRARDPFNPRLCVDLPDPGPSPSCETGAPKTDRCECDGGRHFDADGRCVLPTPAEHRCEIARTTIHTCDQKRGGKSSDQCSALELFRDSALGDQDTESILAGFPDTMTVHFGEGEPHSTAAPQALRKALAPRRGALRGASRVFLLGRADNTSGSASGNDKMAMRRLKVVRAAILSGLTGREREELNARIIDFGLGSNHQMEIEHFAKRYTKILDAGDPTITRILERGLYDLRSKKLPAAREKEVRSAINRSVQIIVVDPECDLDSPPPTSTSPEPV